MEPSDVRNEDMKISDVSKGVTEAENTGSNAQRRTNGRRHE